MNAASGQLISCRRLPRQKGRGQDAPNLLMSHIGRLKKRLPASRFNEGDHLSATLLGPVRYQYRRPSRAKASAVARPMPEAAPVTRATLFLSITERLSCLPRPRLPRRVRQPRWPCSLALVRGCVRQIAQALRDEGASVAGRSSREA